MPKRVDNAGEQALANVLATQPQKTSRFADAIVGYIDDQDIQLQVAKILGIDDESKSATDIARAWSAENNYEDSIEDTLRHILLGGLLVPEKGKMEIGKRIGGALIDYREGADQESLIDRNNNDFGVKLRRDMIERGDTSPDSFIEMAKKYVSWMQKGERGKPINGVGPQRSTVGPLLKQ